MQNEIKKVLIILNLNKKKSPTTLSKLIKLVYVYSSVLILYLESKQGVYVFDRSTVECFKKFNLGKDTLS